MRYLKVKRLKKKQDEKLISCKFQFSTSNWIRNSHFNCAMANTLLSYPPFLYFVNLRVQLPAHIDVELFLDIIHLVDQIRIELVQAVVAVLDCDARHTHVSVVLLVEVRDGLIVLRVVPVATVAVALRMIQVYVVW